MHKIWLILLGCLIATQVQAGTIVGGLLPPKQFDHPFHGRTVVVDAHMESFIMGFQWAGTEESGICTVYINDTLPRNEFRRRIIRHEIGHCNGWPGNHKPQGRG